MNRNFFTLDERKSKASDLSTTAETLAWLARDADPSVRELVAMHPNCPQDAKLALAQDDSSSVRYALIQNPSAAPVVLEALAKDPDPRHSC
ncbi:MAG: hypothetical protein ACMV1D_09800, partial [Macromonas sp.]